MALSEDEADAVPLLVSNYHFVDEKNEPISFALLPIQWNKDEGVDGEKKDEMFLYGNMDNGLQRIYKEVVAWKFDLLDAIPEISVCTKDNVWIKLGKPRKSFEETIREVLITVHCLHFTRMNAEASGKSVWEYLSKAFGSLDVGPSRNDLAEHMDLLQEAVKRDESLAKSKFLLSFLGKQPQEGTVFDEDVQNSTTSKFIVDDGDCISENADDDSDEGDELFDTVCAFCDNGGDILCCEGRCMRSFHATVEAGEESFCESLGFTDKEVKAMQIFVCKNCKYEMHQCFACGKLGSSLKSAGVEVVRCANATCGYFYHPHCVAKLLHLEDENAAEELQKQIAAGESFACPIHKCYVCKQGENKKILELQFAVCRRCPTSYHRKCLPREIAFEDDDEDENIITRAWEDLLPNRVLIYCLKHEIEDDIGTPVRDHIRFPEEKKRQVTSELPTGKGKLLLKKRKLMSENSSLDKTIGKASKKISINKKAESTKRSNAISVQHDSLNKLGTNDATKRSLKKNLKVASKEVDNSATATANNSSLGDMLFDFIIDNEVDKGVMVETSTENVSSELPELDVDTQRRLLALVKEVESSIKLEDVIKKHEVPSTHAYSSKAVVDKTITLGKVEGAVEAVRTALKQLEAGCSIEDAKAVCEPEVLAQLYKWKNKLKVYLAPFLHGMRYTSFGRHFTKVEKLQEIVDILHLYVEDGDMVVDFCCGANDFSCLMKKKLEEIGKKCFYKNYDFFQPKNDFNFEKRDWMTVCPDELPKRGSQLIMGLNPPFGVQGALANKFIDKALEFNPKLLILIVPPKTERLDKKSTPYDLVWEIDELLSGKSFYLPGSVNASDKQMEQWNLTAPPLYLWSRQDWSARHKAIAQKHGHGSKQPKEPNLEKGASEKENQVYHMEGHGSNGETSILRDDLHMRKKEMKETSSGIIMRDGDKESSFHIEDDRESYGSHGSVKNLSTETLRKRFGKEKLGRRSGDKTPEDRESNGKPLESNAYNGMPWPSPSYAVNGRSLLEGPSSRFVEPPLHAEVADNRYQILEPNTGSHVQYGRFCGGSQSSIDDNVYRRYDMNIEEPFSQGFHRFSSHPNWEDQYAELRRDGAGSVGHRSYVTDRESEIRAQVRLYGQNPDLLVQRNSLFGYDPAYSWTRLLSHSHLDSEANLFHRSTTDQNAPQQDALNHSRMNNFRQPMLNRNGIYNLGPGVPQPGYHVDPRGFATGPRHLYPHNSAGWLND
uniref:Uncharacterized protein MANES_15G064900 n=6 Tax=Rhizophora mucronata TaxID=61149 RepID=A0A2P2LWL4_RHIMU